MPRIKITTDTLTDLSGQTYDERISFGQLVSGTGIEVTDGDIVATTANVVANSGDIIAEKGDIIAEDGDVEAVNGTFSSSVTASTGTFTTQVSSALGTFTSVSAPFKLFDIKHPSKENKRLIHGCLEGPELAVYYRGKTNSSRIEFPYYWEDLVDQNTITVHLTPTSLNQVNLICTDVSNNGASVYGANNENYFFIVYGERKDIEKLEVEKDA